jgi:multiple sugar transport system ATP-binding protein
MACVELRNITKRFGSQEVLHHINLKVEDKEFVVLVGPSGCGKSTTLRLIAGLEDVTKGEVMIDEKVVNLVEPQHRNIAMVFQNYALYPHKNVRENIIFGLKRAKAPKDMINRRLARVSKMLELEDFLDRKPAQLSGGQRQRVAMGRAIARGDADVFLFDEPLSNLDAKLRHQMRTEIKRLHREYQTTTIYVTHDQVEAMTLGDKVVLMRDGYLEQQGTPMEIYLRPNNIFVATFIGAPSMNMLDATLFPGFIALEGQKIIFEDKLSGDGLSVPEKGKKVKLGIRPDFFQDEKFVGQEGASLSRVREGTIDIVEPLGFDKEYHIQVGKQILKARLDLRTTAKEGEKITLCFDMNRAHFFDVETEKNLFI